MQMEVTDNKREVQRLEGQVKSLEKKVEVMLEQGKKQTRVGLKCVRLIGAVSALGTSKDGDDPNWDSIEYEASRYESDMYGGSFASAPPPLYNPEKFLAYQEYSGSENPQREDPIFIKMFKEGLGPKHQKVIEMGIPVGNTLTDVLKWANEIEYKANQKKHLATVTEVTGSVAAVETKTPVRCYNCDKKGHMSRECPQRKVCKKCGKKGHWAGVCRGGKPAPPNPTPAPTGVAKEELMTLLAQMATK
ncbi:UNVERIFIED_CONTAM: hypothetical protein FKN15_057072 [Acipenser sinensis]